MLRGIKAELNQIGLKMNKGDIVTVETKSHIHKFWEILRLNEIGINLKHPKNETELFIPWRRVLIVTKIKPDEDGTQSSS